MTILKTRKGNQEFFSLPRDSCLRIRFFTTSCCFFVASVSLLAGAFIERADHKINSFTVRTDRYQKITGNSLVLLEVK